MSQGLIAELERRQQALEEEIAEAILHRSAEDLIAELQRRKLHIRDEIEQLRGDITRERHRAKFLE
jgi:hypothetical protein